ncbi:MAG: ParA family protein [Bacillota bacterium]|jgi:chromosome partitioning protein
MTKVVAVVNQKGGVAKTTTVVNLSSYLAKEGKKMLLVDMDPQGNATSGVGIDRRKVKYCVYDVLINGAPAESVILTSQFENLDILPATIQLAGAEIELVSAISRESKLKKALKPLKGRYDYMLLDCPPSLGLLTLNALTAADSIIVPLQCEYYALEGVSQLMNTFELVKRHLNSTLALEGVLLTMYDARTNLSAQVAEEVKEYFAEKVFDAIIPRSIRLSEAPSHGLPICYYDPKSKGAEYYQQLAYEFLARQELSCCG